MRGAAALVVTAVAATGCGGPAAPAGDRPAPSGSTVAAVPDIRAEAVRLRTDEVVGGRIQLRITDTGDEPFTVTAVALDAPGFAPLAPTAVSAAFVPDRVIDLPTPHGDVMCGVKPATSSARITVVRPNGAVEELRVPLGDAVLQRVHREDCAAQAVAGAVEVRITGLVAEDEGLAGRLTLIRRAGDDRVVVERVGGSVLVDVAADAPLPLEAGEAMTDGPVRFTVATCDAHVLAEAKQPYLFPWEVRLGTAPPVVVDLPVDDRLLGALTDLVARSCQDRGGG
ncbi:hypothetical protein [Blastococcus saxobsidens]|uniref:Lipoprotein n=1 Tax=Blastococcus saxobsidens (strain DD2) TaxID=1146883 RepID=H6RRD4_BLASD|nr:hypothetical protein [Blastococcus saxobsidens]CCG05416.1 conserved protein of unknown function [Blastococcus saxobsidens DD2]